MKKTNKFMNLNRETAMRLWVRDFGKATKAVDFAGRQIAKGAYNDRNSDYGWNIDHILPQSKGGKTTDNNLICCHILTNDEKGDKFPCFVANGKRFEIVKVQNHYEIKEVDNSSKKSEENINNINFYDSASGVRYFKALKGIQNKPRFVGSVAIRIKNITNTAVVDFIENFFDEENISYSLSNNYYSDETLIVAKNYNMPKKDEINTLLDKCVLLNTYMGYYFSSMKYIDSYEILFRVDYFKAKKEMYLKSQNINFVNAGYGLKNSLFINELVIINTEAKDKVQQNIYSEYTEYNYIFTNLKENLIKEVSGK